MPLPNGKELERRYGSLFENTAVQDVVQERIKNDATPVDEDAILEFVQGSDKEHAEYVRSISRRLEELND